MLNEKDAHRILVQFIQKHPTYKSAAIELGISQQYLSDIASSAKWRIIPESVLKGLGLKRVTRIARLKKRRTGKPAKNGQLAKTGT